jgi:hypothetical protein
MTTEGCPGLAHRTVRCATGQCPVHQGESLWTAQLREFGEPLRYNSPDCPVCQRSNGYLRQLSSAKAIGTMNSARLRAQSQSRRQKAHRTVNMTCLVHHQTVQWPHMSELQRSNPNGWVTWLAHLTVSGGAPDCLVRPSTAAFPNGHFGGWGYKYPPTTTLQGIQVFSLHIQYKS